MTEKMNLTPFEEEIRALLSTSDPKPDFTQQLKLKLAAEKTVLKKKQRNTTYLKPVFAALLIAVVLFIASLFYYGPDVVYAAITRLFEYIPGIGLVDQDTPIRILKEPVSITREDITVTVYQASLTVDKTDIKFGVSGIPLSAYAEGEISSNESCMKREYLILPDGSHSEINAPIPDDVNQATLVIPCFFTTLPDTVPTNWEIPLEFIPLPEDVPIIPVQESLPPEQHEETLPLSTPMSAEMNTQSDETAIIIDKTIETEEGYILIGYILTDQEADGWIHLAGIPQIMDAQGSKINHGSPADIQIPNMESNQIPWVLEFDASGVVFPITLQFSGERYTKIEPDTPAKLDFDAGIDPQYGQEWNINQEFSLDEYQFKLKTIRAGKNSYSFTFETQLNTDLTIYSPPNVEISGHQAVGAGGGSGGSSLVFSEMPKGKLELLFSSFLILSEQYTWETQWQPEEIRTDWPTPTVPAADVCVNANNFTQLSAPPADMSGLVLRTEINPNMNLVLTDLIGNQRKVFGSGNNRGALSSDGSYVAYSDQQGIHIVNLADETQTLLESFSSHELRWSPDNNQIALVNPPAGFGIYITNMDGSQQTPVSNLGYETIAGWSPDNKYLYYAIPGSSDEGFLLKSYDIVSGNTNDMFILKDSSLKAPAPRISPDGKWFAYRSINKIHLVSLDGEQYRVILSLPSDQYNVSAAQWDQQGRWLGISVTDHSVPGIENSILYLVDPFDCRSYQTTDFNGNLNGLFIRQGSS